MVAKLDEGLSPSTVQRIRNVLSQALDYAVRQNLISRNVAALTRGPRNPRREGRTLTPEQARQLLAALCDHRHEALFVLMLTTGIRGERPSVCAGRTSTSTAARRGSGGRSARGRHARHRRAEDLTEPTGGEPPWSRGRRPSRPPRATEEGGCGDGAAVGRQRLRLHDGARHAGRSEEPLPGV